MSGSFYLRRAIFLYLRGVSWKAADEPLHDHMLIFLREDHGMVDYLLKYTYQPAQMNIQTCRLSHYLQLLLSMPRFSRCIKEVCAIEGVTSKDQQGSEQFNCKISRNSTSFDGLSKAKRTFSLRQASSAALHKLKNILRLHITLR